jgi:hypothetical protein
VPGVTPFGDGAAQGGGGGAGAARPPPADALADDGRKRFTADFVKTLRDANKQRPEALKDGEWIGDPDEAATGPGGGGGYGGGGPFDRQMSRRWVLTTAGRGGAGRGGAGRGGAAGRARVGAGRGGRASCARPPCCDLAHLNARTTPRHPTRPDAARHVAARDTNNATQGQPWRRHRPHGL